MIDASESTAEWTACTAQPNRCSRSASCSRWKRCTASTKQNTHTFRQVQVKSISSIDSHLQQPVQRNERRQEYREELDQRERRVQHPVDQPLGVVHLGRRFDGLDGHVRRIRHADQIAQQLSAASEHQIQNGQTGGACKSGGSENCVTKKST